ncbi:MAG: pentapeptide repeat-containing protein [Chroococcales cyanobacterium]
MSSGCGFRASLGNLLWSVLLRRADLTFANGVNTILTDAHLRGVDFT